MKFVFIGVLAVVVSCKTASKSSPLTTSFSDKSNNFSEHFRIEGDDSRAKVKRISAIDLTDKKNPILKISYPTLNNELRISHWAEYKVYDKENSWSGTDESKEIVVYIYNILGPTSWKSQPILNPDPQTWIFGSYYPDYLTAVKPSSPDRDFDQRKKVVDQLIEKLDTKIVEIIERDKANLSNIEIENARNFFQLNYINPGSGTISKHEYLFSKVLSMALNEWKNENRDALDSLK